MNCITISVSECFNKTLKIHILLDVNSFNVLNFFFGWVGAGYLCITVMFDLLQRQNHRLQSHASLLQLTAHHYKA